MLSTRRKSCSACVTSKRRCDLGLPCCGRCLERGASCVYPWAEPGQDGAFDNGGGVASNPVVSLIPSTNGIVGPSFSTQDVFWAASTPRDPTNYLPPFSNPSPPSSVPTPLSPAMMSLLGDIVGRGRITSPIDLGIPATTPMNTQTRGLPPAVTAMESLDSGTVATGSVFQPRTEYAARRIAAQACALAEKGQTAFIHHTQVGASAVLQDALAASALHAMRNPSNAAIVRAEIARRSALLVDAVEAAVACSPPVELDLLPPVQSLLIYQCIRLFSMNDIAQQAQAERDGMMLSRWADKLREQVQPFGATGNWTEWVRHESLRRTVLFSALVSGVHTFLKLGWDSGEGAVAPLGFTAQAALWEARSAAEWRRVWTQSPRLEITISTFTRDTQGAGCEDLEELGVVFRAINGGLEALEEWAGGDKTVLKRWGLREEQPLAAY